ncbi:hypothetical protein T479_22560 [Lysinibacillus varians]|nr:hypothetical protein T479_22560 [Lysinibacillus varians]
MGKLSKSIVKETKPNFNQTLFQTNKKNLLLKIFTWLC